MIFLLIIFALFAGVLKLVDIPTVKKIKAASDSQSAIEYRKQLLHNRKVAFWIFVGLIIVYMLYDLRYLDEIEDEYAMGWYYLPESYR